MALMQKGLRHDLQFYVESMHGSSVKHRQQEACLDDKRKGEGPSIGSPHIVPAARQAVEGTVKGPQLQLSDGVARVADAKHEPGSQM